MTTTGPRHSKEEFARRGDEIFERRVKPTLTPDDDGKYVAIDIETGDFAIDADDYAATHRVRAGRPDAQIWLMRAGPVAAYRTGMRYRAVKS